MGTSVHSCRTEELIGMVSAQRGPERKQVLGRPVLRDLAQLTHLSLVEAVQELRALIPSNDNP
jgi:hypothetical protein